MGQDSVVLAEQIRVIDKRRIIRVLGHLGEDPMDNIKRVVVAVLGL